MRALKRFSLALMLAGITVISSEQPASAYGGAVVGGAAATVAALLTLKKNAEDISSGLAAGARRQLESFIRNSVEPLIDRIDAGVSANIKLAGVEGRQTVTHAAQELKKTLLEVIFAAEAAAASRTAAADQALAARISQATTELHGLLNKVNEDVDRLLCRVMPSGKPALFGLSTSKWVWWPRSKHCWEGQNINNAWLVEIFTDIHWVAGRLCELDEQIRALDLTSKGSWEIYTSLLLEAAKVSEIGRCEGVRLATRNPDDRTAKVYLRRRRGYQSRLEDIYSANQLASKYLKGNEKQ